MNRGHRDSRTALRSVSVPIGDGSSRLTGLQRKLETWEQAIEKAQHTYMTKLDI